VSGTCLISTTMFMGLLRPPVLASVRSDVRATDQ
jgi:hypothetical protein